MANPGLFISLEGGEGAGKSTQAARLAERLKSHGHAVIQTREPGGTPTGEHLRATLLNPDVDLGPMEQVLLFYAARRHHVDHLIRPALQKGAIVICDRFSDSTRAYQGAAGGISDDAVMTIDRTVLSGFAPDLTLLLDLPVDAGRDRVVARGEAGDRFEDKPSVFHERLRQAFLHIAANEPARVAAIDARQSVADVEAAIWHHVAARLELTRS